MTEPGIVCELKWSQHTGADSLNEVMWDLSKLAHAGGRRHRLTQLIGSGCPADLAARIVAPLTAQRTG